MSGLKEEFVHWRLKPPQKQVGKHLFTIRMEREGRIKEYRRRIQEEMSANDLMYEPARKKVMAEMGYVDTKTERKLALEREAKLAKNAIKNEQDEIREERAISNFEEAIATLPLRCPISQELDWIKTHPAMARKNRRKNGTEQIMITANDILYTSAGKAPSQQAVYSLQNWANRPEKFYEMLMTEQKKKSEDSDAAKGMDSDADIAQVERLLREVPGAVNE